MGGTRFAHLGATVRIDRPTHDAIAAEVIASLETIGIHAQPLRPLRAKADFGDVDLITKASQTHSGLPADSDKTRIELDLRDARTAAAVGAIAHDRGAIGNPTLHMLMDAPNGLVQIDLTSIDDATYDFAERHMAWGDAGSLAAVIAGQMGMKVGMNGVRLAMNTRHGAVAAPLPLDHMAMLNLLGLDAEAHAAGFDTPEQIYQWIADSAYFDPKIWGRDWRTNRARARGMKRPTYTGWLEWLETQRPPARYDWGDRRGARTPEWTEMLRERFPETARILDEEAGRIARRQQTPLRLFFNGPHIAAQTGVEGEQLGHLMNAIRKDLGEDGLERLASTNDLDTLITVARRLAEDLR